jgi:hypothetical protein
MFHEELGIRFKDELSRIRDYGCSDTERNSILKNISTEIGNELDIQDLSTIICNIDDTKSIVFRFNYSGDTCKTGCKYNIDTITEDIANNISDIIDGTNALNYINSTLNDRLSDGIKLQYIWGKAEKNGIYYWDYDSIKIRMSEDAMSNMLSKYRTGELAFKLDIDKIINDTEQISDIYSYVSKFNDLEINKYLKVSIDTADLTYELSSNMLSRKDAIEIIKNNSKDYDIIELRIVEIVEQLGTYIAIADIEFKSDNKSCKIKLLGDQVIDLSNKEIIANYAICSRIEKLLAIKEADIGLNT